MMDNKFINHNIFWKRKVRENKTPNQCETCFIKQHENMRQKRARKNAEEREVYVACDKKQKCVKLAIETDE